MNPKEKDDSNKQHEALYRNIGMILFCILGILLIYGYFLINSSEEIHHYFTIAASDTSGFRFIVFLGILKYGILLLGLSMIITTITMFIKQRINKTAP